MTAHGTTMYRTGCRCSVCRRAKREYDLSYVHSLRCEATAVRTGKRCRRRGEYDPVNDGIRCDLHEARGGQCEAFCTGANGRVGRRCNWTGIWDNYHQRWLCEFHARAARIAYTPGDALLILRDNQRQALRDWRERQKEAA